MTQEKFTPAPWFTKIGKTYCCIRVDDMVIADMRTVNAVYNEHNAHLIAAAPEMYDLLNHIVKMSSMTPYQLDVIESLLAKARGEI